MTEFLEILKYILLGLIQGIAEPLPVSSSGHLIFIDRLLNNPIPSDVMSNFQVIVNLASLLAIIIFFRKFILELITGSFKYLFKKDQSGKDNFNYVVYVLIASIPVGIVGIILKIYDVDKHLTNLLIVGISLLVTSIILTLGYAFSKKTVKEDIILKDSFIIGIIQIFALVPGISRSGLTTTTGLQRKVHLKNALVFSFMLYIVASLGASLVGLFDILKNGFSININILGFILAFVASFTGTIIVINLFFKYLNNKYLKYFAIYCFTIGIIILSLLRLGVI